MKGSFASIVFLIAYLHRPSTGCGAPSSINQNRQVSFCRFLHPIITHWAPFFILINLPSSPIAVACSPQTKTIFQLYFIPPPTTIGAEPFTRPHNRMRSTKINVNKSAERRFQPKPDSFLILMATIGCVLKSMKIKSITFRLLFRRKFFLSSRKKKGGKRAKLSDAREVLRVFRKSSHFPGTLKTNFSSRHE